MWNLNKEISEAPTFPLIKNLHSAYNQSMSHSPRSNAGFTLIELLMVFTVVALLSFAAVSSYVAYSKNFAFLADYKPIVEHIRLARSNAVTNNVIGEVDPNRYGVFVDRKEVIVFADNGSNELVFDPKPDNAVTDYAEDLVLAGKNHDFSETDYVLAVEAGLEMPMTIFYNKTSGEVSVFHTASKTVVPGLNNNILVDKKNNKSIEFSFSDGDFLNKNFTLYYISGLIEDVTAKTE